MHRSAACCHGANALFFLLFLAFAVLTPAVAEQTSGHAINPGTPEAKPAEAAQSGAKPSTENRAQTKPTAAKPAAGAASTEAKPVDAKTSAPSATKPGEPAETQAKPATEESAAAKPGTGVAEPKSDTTPPRPEKKEAAAEPEPAKPAGKQILVNVDKSTQEMTVFVDGIEEYRWPVSTGTYGYTTPSGSYTATSMNEIWYSKQWDNAPMPHSIFFTKKGHAIHGSKEVKKLGTPASHGCVRLSPANAKTLFALVKANGLENTQVVIGGETPGGEAVAAAEPRYPQYGQGDPWFGPGYYPPPPRYYKQQRQRRKLFGRGWFQPYGAPQGYYRPPRGYYRPY